MKYDTTLKELFQAAPQRLLQILVGGEAVELLTIEYPDVKMRRPDLVVRLTDGRIYHLELQSSNEKEIPWRLLEYYCLIYGSYAQAPVQHVLYVGAEALNMTAEIQHQRLQYSYEVIDIRMLDSTPLLESKSLEDNLLAILCRVSEVKLAIKQIIERISELSDKARSDALVKLLILAGLRDWQRLVIEEARQMAITLDIRENSFLNDVFQEGELKGIEQGINKGESALLRRLLVRRFGSLPEWAEQKLNSSDRETLERWGLQLLDANSLAEALQ